MMNDVRMELRELVESDLSLRVEWMNNPAVYNTMHYSVPILLGNTQEWFKRNRRNPDRYDVVFEDENGTPVAMGGLTGIDSDNFKAELYIFVNPLRQGEGLGTLATRLLCKYGFESLKLNKIYLYTDAGNKGACKVYEKVGFKLEGCLRNENRKGNRREDRLYFGMFPQELVLS